MGMTQMNVRIDEDLKAAGDAAFRAAGVTPSEVVRSVWEYAARNGGSTKSMGTLLRVIEGGARPSVEEARAEKLKLVDEAVRLVKDGMERFGFAGQEESVELDWDELRWEAYLDKAQERGWEL